MRIFLSCLQSLRPHPLPAYDFWQHYLREGCTEGGWSVLEAPDVDWAEGLLDLDPGARSAWMSRTWSRTLDVIRREHARDPIGLFLGYLYPQQVDEGALGELRRLGIPTVNFFCDNLREFRRVPPVYRPFDLHWVPEFEALPMYRAAGLRHLHAPMPAWIPPASRTAEHPDREPPTFIGSADLLRQHLLADAVTRGADLMVRGRGWTPEESVHQNAGPARTGMLTNQWHFVRKHGAAAWLRKCRQRLAPPAVAAMPPDRVGSTVSGSEYVRLTQQAVVTIGINRVPTFRRPFRHPLTYSRLRDIEAPMLGACYLTEWTEGLPHLYDIGTEIESYRSAEELRDTLAALQGDPAKRQRMRRAAQRRALGQHSIAATLEKIRAAVT